MTRAKTLIIGYGNTLRSDDGVGVRVAEAIAWENYPDLNIITLHQLTPEIASDIGEAKAVIFVDATLTQATVTVQSITPNLDTNWTGHHTEPESLLSLTQAIYGKTPPAWWILIPGINFELGETLSSLTQKHQHTALGLIHELILGLRDS